MSVEGTTSDTARCVFCGEVITWSQQWNRWLDEDGVAVPPSHDEPHAPSSCLGCGQVGTRAIWHDPTGIYLCAERCVPRLRGLSDVASRFCLHGVRDTEQCEECGLGFTPALGDRAAEEGPTDG